MSRIVVEVFVPAAGKSSDLFIPYEARLHEVTQLVKSVLAEASPWSFAPDDDTVLCDRDTGGIYNAGLTVEELGLLNGSKLMLI